MIDLVSHYSQTLLGTLCTFNSYYATRLYQLIVCETRESPNKPKEEWEFTCEQLREFFQIGEKQYKLPRNLLNYTIIPAIKELNNSPYAHIWDYEELHAKGRGRALIGVRFKAQVFKNQEEKIGTLIELCHLSAVIVLPIGTRTAKKMKIGQL